MKYSVAADLVVIIHLAFVLFVVLGGFLLRRRWVPFLHLPAAIWGALVELAGWPCPLTPLEWHLRAGGGQAGYSGGFIEHYLLPALYPQHLSRPIQIGLGLAVIGLNLVLYLRRFSGGKRNLPRSGGGPSARRQ